MTALLSGVLVLLGSALAVAMVYDLAISIGGLFRPRVPPKSVHHSMRFALLIAAHNEEAVIARAIESLRAQHYSPDDFAVFVVADRCADRTADAARAAGAVVVERKSGRGGKAPALRHLLDEICARSLRFDAVCVFDADNVVAPDFLQIMNRHLASGRRCIQGYLDVKNPGDSWVTGSIAIGYWNTNRLWQAARDRLGLCCALGGTGFCLRWDLAVSLAWKSDCLTDDLELQMQLVRVGERVSWAHDAHVYDEKPITLAASVRQRLRWIRGHWDVALRHTRPLIAQGISSRSLVALDAALYTLQPLRTVVAALVLGWAGLAVTLGESAWSPWMTGLLVAQLSYLNTFCFLGLPAIGLALDRIPLRYWRFYAHAFVFGLTWIPICAWGIATVRRTTWTHTLHTRSLTIHECEPPTRSILPRDLPLWEDRAESFGMGNKP